MLVNGEDSRVFRITGIFRHDVPQVLPIILEVAPVEMRIRNENLEKNDEIILFCDDFELLVGVTVVVRFH